MGKKLNTEDFIKRAKEVHGDKYDYSKVEYKGNSKKVIIICPEHREFEQIPANHLRGAGCKKCATIETHKKQSNTTESFIKKAKEVHGDKYDYSKVEYINNREKVIIICPEHGPFKQKPL